MSKLPTFRHNRVAAFDSKYTGEEPVWDLQHTWDDETFKKEYLRLFGFYGYYLTSKDMRADVILFIKREKETFTPKELDIFQSLPDWAVSGTTGKIARSLNRGLDHARVTTLTGEDIRGMAIADVKAAIKNYGPEFYKEDNDSETEASPMESGPSIQERLKKKVLSTLGMDLDNLIDEWIKGEDKADPLKIANSMEKHGVPVMGLKYFQDILVRMKAEYQAALDKDYPEATEGYSYLSKKGINNRIAAIEAMEDEISKITHAKKANRKPRVKKPKAAEKQVSKMKFMQASADYSIKSISPLSIPGAHRVFIFNTKNRVLSMLESNSATGLEVKGSGIRNFNESSSFSIRLRKPNDVLPEILNKTLKQIEKLTDSLTTKRSKPNGRMTDTCIILRTFANK